MDRYALIDYHVQMSSRITIIILLSIIAISLVIIKNQLFPKLEITRSETTISESPSPSITVTNENQQKIIGETHYLFNIADNGPEQIKTLLERAESLSTEAKYNNMNSRIAMVIHGPDIKIFENKNYQTNKEIVDLAARLDAQNVIDFKVCKVSANSRGIKDSSLPAFMEIVPFSVTEIKRLEKQGYIQL
ncbi:MAG: DsrE family protein [Gammaproteobacteria bacterium]